MRYHVPPRHTFGRQAMQAAAVLLVFSAVGGILTAVLTPYLDFAPAAPDLAAIVPREIDNPQVLGPQHYLPPAPYEAPSPLRETVMAGYRIALGQDPNPDVPPRNAQGTLSCRSCHFEGGQTDGGPNHGFSLVGAASQFPRAEEDGTIVDLPGRVNRCVVRHMGKEPWRRDSLPMQAVVAYLSWISEGVPQYADVSWLDVPPLDESSRASPSAAEALFGQQCNMCHGDNGQGTPAAPPLWGNASFRADGEMARRGILARFIHWNMPRGTPSLSSQQAVDLAAYLLAQPRPTASDRIERPIQQ